MFVNDTQEYIINSRERTGSMCIFKPCDIRSRVYVLNSAGAPLMPCPPGKARALLNAGQAKVVSRSPFAIKLLYGSSGYKQPVALGIDSGSKVIGVAATGNGKVLYASEVTNRRGRKLRYRKARWANGRRPKGWLTPAMTSKVRSHPREIEFVKRILPITRTIIETASFDIHKIVNRGVSGEGYQQGRRKDFYHLKQFVLSREGHCLKLQKKRKPNTADAIQVSTIGSYLKKSLSFEETFGYETKFTREGLGLPKEHYIDAVCVGLSDREIPKLPDVLCKKVCIPLGDYKQTAGGHFQKLMPTGKLMDIRKFDKVKCQDQELFIKGRMSTGYAVLMDIEGKTVDLKPMAKLKLLLEQGVGELVDSAPEISAAEIVRKLKQESTVSVWKRFPRMLKRHFWTDGYFVSTTGNH